MSYSVKSRAAVFFLVTMLIQQSAMHAQTITTIAGNGSNGFAADGAVATSASIGETFGVITDQAGNVYFAESSNNLVRKISTSGILTTIAGNTIHGYSGDGGPATAAELAFPSGITFDLYGNLYIADANNSRIRKVDTAGIITTFAGTGTPGFSGDGGPATAAMCGYSDGIFADLWGNILLPDPLNTRIRKVNSSGIISTVAGIGAMGHSGDGAPATLAMINNPSDLVVDLDGNLYFSDFGDNSIREVTAAGIMKTICGNGTPLFSGDGGPATAASIYAPIGVCMDYYGNFYLSDRYNYRIRQINGSGLIGTICGNGTNTYSGDGGPASAATVNGVHGVHLDEHGNLYFADRYNYAIRKITAAVQNRVPAFTTPGPSIFHVCASGGVFSLDTAVAAIDTDMGQTLHWRVYQGPAHGALGGFPAVAATTGSLLSPAGLTYTAAGAYYGADTFSVLVSDQFASRIRKIVVRFDSTPVAGHVSGTDSLCQGKNDTLTATVAGGAWLSSNTALGTISPAGVFSGAAAGTDTVFYIISNTCGKDTAKISLKIKNYGNCPAEVSQVNTNDAPSLKVMPNPTAGFFTMTCITPSEEPVRIVISDMLGQRVFERTIRTNSPVEIMLNETAGLYLISAFTKEKILTGKLCITR